MKSYSLEDEAGLVKRLSKGNLLAFNTLFREYSGRLFRFANGYLKSEAESEEVVQEVFTIIWEKRESLDPDLSFKSYIFTISFNIIRKHFRKNKNISKYLNEKVNNDLDNRTLQTVDYNSLYEYVSDIVDQLPLRRREIFVKSRFEGLSIKEISEELEISHKTVENQLSDALKYIRTKIRKEDYPLILFFMLFIA
ncbi:MAG: RNA polymerase sigma-70 factor [Bacteroidales bacterium]|jgi:RNA polymerase sigma-70 factor (ECF subfamily)|nr:RNA polymerase sigma-70 factor [Bacteroidales bacterium]